MSIPWQCPACLIWLAPGIQWHRCADVEVGADVAQTAAEVGAALAQIPAEVGADASEVGADLAEVGADCVEVGAADSALKVLSSKASKPSNPKTATKAKHEYTDGFELWWKVYPLRLGKWKAFCAWRSACDRAAQDELISGAERYAQFCASNPDRSIKYAEGWLNGDRWLDEYPVSLNGQVETAFDRAAREAMADAD